MVNPTLAGFVVDVEILEVVVEIYGSGAEVASEEGCVCSEDGTDVDVPFSAQRDRQTGLPFVEMCDDGGGEVGGDVLSIINLLMEIIREIDTETHFSQEPRNQIPKNDCLIRLMIIRRGRDPSQIPQVALPLVQLAVRRPSIEQNNLRRSFYKPPSIKHLNALLAHVVECGLDRRIGWLLRLYLHGCGLVG